MTIEEHPLEPFLPQKAKMLFLGSFPPPQTRWSMSWFYPNYQNDFWRIQGLIHFGDRHHFEVPDERRFDKDRVVTFCEEKGIALFDTARKVCRLKDNADDNFLEIVEGTDVFALLEQMPDCRIIVTTGGKASEELQAYLEKQGVKVQVPKVGDHVGFPVTINPERTSAQTSAMLSSERTMHWYRMPSSSRAYPMKLEKKAEHYQRLWDDVKHLNCVNYRKSSNFLQN